ncbi:MAG TPA: hypothetical protein PLO65_05900 [Caulobacter sp.]|nr:hypothetical protein [Caulobacter sp.]
MRRSIPALTALLLAAVVSGAASAEQTDADLCRLERSTPRDVVDFMQRWADCAHWGGEEAYDADRDRQIRRAVRELRCDRLDRDEAALRRKYAGRTAVLAALDIGKDQLAWPECPRRQ